MAAEKANYEIVRMARLLKVARSGCYAWAQAQRQALGSRAVRRAEIDSRVRAAYAASDEVYGAPRITADLIEDGYWVDRKTVAVSMRRQGLEGISPRMFQPVTTVPGVSTHNIPDRVERVFDTGVMDGVWISDITYLRTGEGWLYLCAVLDAHSRRVLGWAMDQRQGADLVERALRMAHTLRGQLSCTVVFPADRGAQYTSAQLHRAAKELQVDQSMGRTGVCWDNAMSESFWATLKTEFYHRRAWSTRAEARREVARWIEIVYNRRRRHSALDYSTPVAFETASRTATENETKADVITQAA